jgi:uncharacterized protein (TIGR00159 family)
LELILNILQVTSWREVPVVLLDLVLIYYVLYRILLLIKGTRAAQMVFGLTLVIVFFFISDQRYADLRITNWFIEKFIANFIIVAVVIFQHDIRRALAQAGNTQLFSQQRSIEESSVLEEVIKASVMLSSRKIGALIAIERQADLSEFVEDGIALDAAVSKDLLFSIFLAEHQNPLHDGATIIQRGRIAAAGCFLPLTNNTRVEKTLGTRHRAGIGLSEDTDAALVIVSEESGNISIAYQGELIRDLEATTMRAELQKIFAIRDEEEQRKRFSLRDLFQRAQSGGER